MRQSLVLLFAVESGSPLWFNRLRVIFYANYGRNRFLWLCVNGTVVTNYEELTKLVKMLKQRIHQLLLSFGWLNTLIYLLGRLLGRISQNRVRIYKYYLVMQPVHKKPLLPPGRGKNIKIRLIDKEDEVIHQFPRPYKVIQDRFKNGAKCLVAFKDQQFIGFIWLVFDCYQEDEVRANFILSPIESTAWDFDIYIKPDFRLGMTFARLWDEANNFLLMNKRNWTYSRVSAFNTESLKSHSYIGAKSFGSALFFCVTKWQITIASLYPYFHLSFHNDSIPQFYLKTDALKDL